MLKVKRHPILCYASYNNKSNGYKSASICKKTFILYILPLSLLFSGLLGNIRVLV